MKTKMAMVRCAGWVLYSTTVVAAPILPISYDMRNGQTGSYNWWDDTYSGSGNSMLDGTLLTGGLGQLTDGILGTFVVGACCTPATAYPWIGWASIQPDITFNFGSPTIFTSAGFHAANPHTGGIALWGSVTLSFSIDGINFGNSIAYTTTPAEQADLTARFTDVAINNQTAQYIRATFTDSPSPTCGTSSTGTVFTCPWIFLSEARFDAVPEPAMGWATLGALVLVGLRKRFRSSR